jgi:hypothetical protein
MVWIVGNPHLGLPANVIGEFPEIAPVFKRADKDAASRAIPGQYLKLLVPQPAYRI